MAWRLTCRACLASAVWAAKGQRPALTTLGPELLEAPDHFSAIGNGAKQRVVGISHDEHALIFLTLRLGHAGELLDEIDGHPLEATCVWFVGFCSGVPPS